MLNPVLKRSTSRAILFLAFSLAVYIIAKYIVMLNESGIDNKIDVTVGSKNFTESRLVAELYAKSLENAGYRVRRRFDLGGTLIAHAALQKGEIDVYPEYTGTGLINVLHHAPIKNEGQAISILNQIYQKEWKLQWLNPSQANNSQGLAVTRQTADKKQLYTVSKMAALSPSLRLASIPEFEDRSDGLKGLKTIYPNLHFKKIRQYDNSLKYQVIRTHKADVVVAFSTDGELSHSDLILLKDDKHFWPGYHVAPVIRQETLAKHPSVQQVLNRVSNYLDTETLRQLNAAIDIQKQDYRTMARLFLVRQADNMLGSQE